MPIKILIAAGGSGGHLLPAQQLARELKHEGAEILFAGYRLDISRFFNQKEFSFRAISAAPLRWTPKGLFTFFKEVSRGIFQSIRLIRKFRPDVVVGFGSFHCFPILLAAFFMKRKIVLFEANCILGKVNRLFAPASQMTATQFTLNHLRPHFRLVPLLPWTVAQPLPDKEKALLEWGFSLDRPVFLIFGGSQGASFLNRAIPVVLPKNAQVIHLAGSDEAAKEVAKCYQREGITAVVKSFETNMINAYAAADFAICRSGAGTVAELIRYSLPALLIPFPLAADDHQKLNAEFLAKKIGGAALIIEKDASPMNIRRGIEKLYQDGKNMKAALWQLYQNSEGRLSFGQQILKMEL